MFDRAELGRALDLQAAGYALMAWLGDSMRRQPLHFDAVHDRLSPAESARAWVARNEGIIPERTRVAPQDRDAFGNVLASFLDVSLELRGEPQLRIDSTCGCPCPWCATVVEVSRLRTKKPSARDKRRAAVLMSTALVRTARDAGIELDEDTRDRLLGEPDLRPAIAMTAWAQDLLRRVAGERSSTAALALWRTFAWTATGSPKPGFEITLDAVLAAEQEVLEAARSAFDPPA